VQGQRPPGGNRVGNSGQDPTVRVRSSRKAVARARRNACASARMPGVAPRTDPSGSVRLSAPSLRATTAVPACAGRALARGARKGSVRG
jgi:hypothetical protein